ncbi:Transposase [Cordylochernes scorpioides]|uniref:Transposase n=1 Tax=Cordylochernes scorpioides TaxID=51811 RepID=A0ABY6KCQ1_9ARAC|nr:Transposase [Cordylochernes scorpioides]
MELTPSQISKLIFRAPPFLPKDIPLWLNQLEAAFNFANIASDDDFKTHQFQENMRRSKNDFSCDLAGHASSLSNSSSLDSSSFCSNPPSNTISCPPETVFSTPVHSDNPLPQQPPSHEEPLPQQPSSHEEPLPQQPPSHEEPLPPSCEQKHPLFLKETNNAAATTPLHLQPSQTSVTQPLQPQNYLQQSSPPIEARVTTSPIPIAPPVLAATTPIAEQPIVSLQPNKMVATHYIRTTFEKDRTISRRLVANGLHSCRPLRRLPLTPPNRRQRLEWCRARSTWMTEWHRVVFSDESLFCLSSDSRRVRVWRRHGERSNPAAIVERPTVRQCGIMVWGAFAYDSRSPLFRIQGTMTAQRYVDDVLRPVTLPYLQGVPNALYQQDNARPHTARISQQALQDVQMLPWPPYSPDLSPIEHVWDIIGRRLHALPQPRSEGELWQMVEREWRAIPQDAFRTLIDSLPRRVAACIAVRGGPTCY